MRGSQDRPEAAGENERAATRLTIAEMGLRGRE